MPLSWTDIVLRAQERMHQRNPLIRKMQLTAAHYDGDWVIPVPGTENTLSDPLGPALITEAVDTVALRCASLFPELHAPALDPFKREGVRSVDYARRRRLACEDTWRRAEELLVLGKEFRHLVAYAMFAHLVEPDHDTGQPMIRVLDPLMVYPEFRADTDFRPQSSVAIIYQRSGAEIMRLWPQAEQFINLSPVMVEAPWHMVEWYDRDQTTIGCMGMDWAQSQWGAAGEYHRQPGSTKGAPFHLVTTPNRTGLCPIVVGGQISLTKAMARLAGFSAQIEVMAKMTALVIAAAEKSVFPDRYIIGKDGDVPLLVGGTWKDGRTGEPNLLANVTSVGEVRGTPDPIGMQVVDRMERNMRISTGQSSIMSGEQSTNALRTGRAIDSLMGASMDPRIAELQRISAVATKHTNSLILETYKTWWPNRQYTLFGFGRSARGVIDFTPSVHVETTETEARYPFAGSDLDAATIRATQLVGTEMISRKTGRKIHPLVEDPEQEEQLILAEKVEAALLQTYVAQAADPAAGLPLADQARIAQLVTEGKTLSDAMTQAHKEAQERQAKMAPPPAPDSGMIAAPETMPGVGMPGQGQEQPAALPSTMQQTTTPLQDFKSLVQAGRVPYGGSTGPLG